MCSCVCQKFFYDIKGMSILFFSTGLKVMSPTITKPLSQFISRSVLALDCLLFKQFTLSVDLSCLMCSVFISEVSTCFSNLLTVFIMLNQLQARQLQLSSVWTTEGSKRCAINSHSGSIRVWKWSDFELEKWKAVRRKRPDKFPDESLNDLWTQGWNVY